ncbi:MAG TPA: NADH-quinone oxidoreductase subunit NuoE [Casimicrobiaceae bacterium]|nr:NADH-quinone oxidoreductase subunit NuoE [Casimicrobiaceae bacterium]
MTADHILPIPSAELAALRSRYPAGFASSLVLPCLRRIQELQGFVADEDIGALATALGVARVQVEEVLSFYTQYRREAVGRWQVAVCRNVSCSMRGAERVIEACKHKLGIDVGETTPDGRVTLSTVECLGSCGTAPVVMVNEKYVENVGVESVDGLLDSLK